MTFTNGQIIDVRDEISSRVPRGTGQSEFWDEWNNVAAALVLETRAELKDRVDSFVHARAMIIDRDREQLERIVRLEAYVKEQAERIATLERENVSLRGIPMFEE